MDIMDFAWDTSMADVEQFNVWNKGPLFILGIGLLAKTKAQVPMYM